jgi:hypothetical protein
MPGREADPVSVEMEPIAEKLLRRAYAQRGDWAGTYLKNPSAEWMLWGRRNGRNLLGPDPVPSGKARTDWARQLVRACYRQHRKYMTRDGLRLDDEPRPLGIHPPYPLMFQVGTVRLTPAGLVVGRAVRIKLAARGTREYREKIAAIPDDKRWITEDGHAGPANAQGGW